MSLRHFIFDLLASNARLKATKVPSVKSSNKSCFGESFNRATNSLMKVLTYIHK